MKQKIKDFFTQKRCKKLLNNKGFSLLEVLVAVAIIGIVSAIAIPQYTANRTEAAKVAGMTSISNINKAYQNCMVLKSFSKCNTLGEIGISCADCEEDSDGDTGTSKKFCAYIEKESGGKTFRACVSIEGDDIKRSIGGDLLDDVTICHEKTYASGNAYPSSWSVTDRIKYCTVKTECGTDSSCTPGTDCTTADKIYECQKSVANGKCTSKACT